MLLSYGEKSIDLNLNEIDSANCNVLVPNEVTLTQYSTEDQINIIKNALSHPLNEYSIEKWYSPNQKLVIIIPDITRHCSVSIYLKELIDQFEKQDQYNTQNILIMVATGNHRACSEIELEKLVGSYIYQNYTIKNHNSEENLEYIGRTKSENKIFINKDVVRADKILVTGGVAYHNFAGFSGGRKSILPGVAGKETILYNHKLMVKNSNMNKNCKIGVCESNPIHEDMIEAVSLLDLTGEKIYCLNVVPNMYGQIISAFSGHINDVFKSGMEFVADNYKINVEDNGDMVICISGGFPYDINFYQSFKSLYSANQITKIGGHLFLICECREGLGDSFEKFKFWFSKENSEIIDELSKNFDTVGQIAYWTKYSMKSFKLSVITEEENFKEFNSIGLSTISLNDFKSNVSQILKDKQDSRIYLIPYANITCFEFKNE